MILIFTFLRIREVILQQVPCAADRGDVSRLGSTLPVDARPAFRPKSQITIFKRDLKSEIEIF